MALPDHLKCLSRPPYLEACFDLAKATAAVSSTRDALAEAVQSPVVVAQSVANKALAEAHFQALTEGGLVRPFKWSGKAF